MSLMENQVVSEFLVVGAGPVGLLTALLLAREGRSVRIIDRATGPNQASFALALHSEVVEMFSLLGLLPGLQQKGRSIQKIILRDGEDQRGVCDLKTWGVDDKAICVLPQCQLERLLMEQLNHYGVQVEWGRELRRFLQLNGVIEVNVVHLEERAQGYATSTMRRLETGSDNRVVSVVLAADGADSITRDLIGGETVHCYPPTHFAVFEFETAGKISNEFNVVFGKDGNLSALWPMPDGRARWSFQVPVTWEMETPVIALESFIKERAPWFSSVKWQLQWHGKVTFGYWFVQPFAKSGVFLLGDAAHQTHPFGIQSMNNGLLESYKLCQRLLESKTSFSLDEICTLYNQESHDSWSQLLRGGDSLKELIPEDSWLKDREQELMMVLPVSSGELPLALKALVYQ